MGIPHLREEGRIAIVHIHKAMKMYEFELLKDYLNNNITKIAEGMNLAVNIGTESEPLIVTIRIQRERENNFLAIDYSEFDARLEG